MGWATVGRLIVGVVGFVITAPFVLLSAAVFIVVGPILWVPLVVRSLVVYAVMLLLHAIIGRRVQASTAALEASIAWYLASIPKILLHLGDPFRVRVEEPAEPETTVQRSLGDRYNPLKAEFWEGVLDGTVMLIRQSAWAAVFWAGVIFWLVHYGSSSVKEFITERAFSKAGTVSSTITTLFPSLGQHAATARPGRSAESVDIPGPHSVLTETAQAQSDVSPPVPTGAPHDCGGSYPPDAVRLEQQGITKLAFRITTRGHVTHIRVTRSSGSTHLDDAAVSCVSKWLYTPAHRGFRPVRIYSEAQIQWTLH